MQANQASRTAIAAAAVRAAHVLRDAKPLVCADDYALRMTSKPWQVILKSDLLHWLVFRKLLGVMRPIRSVIIGRQRFAEDALLDAIERGVDQYVLVGAGFDSFALRRPDLAERLAIFEVDHPDTQQAKQERVLELVGALPTHVRYLPLDFEMQTVVDALKASDFDPAKPAIFAWLGVVAYLTPDAVFSTLKSLADYSAAGSELIFDYAIPLDLVPAHEMEAMQALLGFVEKRGEPLKSEFDPVQLAGNVQDMGYRVISDLTPEGQDARLYANRADDLRAFAACHFMHLGL